MKIKIKRVLIAGVIVTVIAQIIHSLFAQLDMKYYLMPQYFSVWSRLMMPTAGPPPLSFMVYSLLFTLIGAILMALAYAMVKRGIPGKNRFQKGLVYGLILVLVSGIPFFLTTVLLINVPLVLMISWLLATIIHYFIGGVVIAAIIK